MFQWDKTINAVNIPASRVVSLFRSMRDVQLALPGVPAQQASAFLCQYQVSGGVTTVAVFHLHKAPVLAFYFGDPRVVPEQKADSMLDQGLNFVESMGFLLTDQDLHLLDAADQEMLWASLPLKNGLARPDESPVAAVLPLETATPPDAAPDQPAASAAAVPPSVRPAKEVVEPAVVNQARPFESAQTAARAETEAETADNVNDLLAAVEAMRAKRPGLRARKQPPSAEEMGRRRQQLRETIGRILASL